MEPVCFIRTLYMLLSIVGHFHSPSVNCESFKRDKPRRVSYAIFVRNPFTKLNASSLTTVRVSSLGECTLECANSEDCVSVNFGNEDKGKHTCELFNTDRFKQPEKFISSQAFHHYNIKVSRVA